MKKLFPVALALLAIMVVGLAVGPAVLAQDPESTPPPAGFRGGPRWGGARLGVGPVSEAVLDLLGMTRDELYAERQAGKTLGQIANERGVSDEALIEAIVAEQRALIEQAVADGRLTRAQADWLIAKAEALAPFHLSNPFAPGGLSGRQQGGLGRGGWRFGPCPMHQVAPEGTSS